MDLQTYRAYARLGGVWDAKRVHELMLILTKSSRSAQRSDFWMPWRIFLKAIELSDMSMKTFVL